MWGEEDAHMPSVTSTLFKEPLPGVPEEDMKHEWVTNMIHKYPHLFEIVTPIQNAKLRSLLVSHPNCCRWENGSVYRLPTKLDLEVQNIPA